jgi:hypothetical protein
MVKSGARPGSAAKEYGMTDTPNSEIPETQLLHLVFGGELENLEGGLHFRDLDKLDIVGVYPDYDSAYDAWKSVAQQTVDNAHMRYFVVHLHRLLSPDTD